MRLNLLRFRLLSIYKKEYREAYKIIRHYGNATKSIAFILRRIREIDTKLFESVLYTENGKTVLSLWGIYSLAGYIQHTPRKIFGVYLASSMTKIYNALLSIASVENAYLYEELCNRVLVNEE